MDTVLAATNEHGIFVGQLCGLRVGLAVADAADDARRIAATLIHAFRIVCKEVTAGLVWESFSSSKGGAFCLFDDTVVWRS